MINIGDMVLVESEGVVWKGYLMSCTGAVYSSAGRNGSEQITNGRHIMLQSIRGQIFNVPQKRHITAVVYEERRVLVEKFKKWS